MWDLIGSAIGALANNANTQNAINANKQSQQENREYNLNLAKMQNLWNRDQWQREADYNSPAAYRARLKAAGMNPDLAYGNVQGVAPASAGMTSGQASQPVDNSLLAQKMTALNVASAALDNRLKSAQVKILEEDAKNKNLDNRLKGYEVKNEDALQALVGDPLSATMDASKLPLPAYRKYMEIVNSAKDSANKTVQNEEGLLRLAIARLDKLFRDATFEGELKKFANSVDISDQEARYYIETLTHRIASAKYDAKIKEGEAFMNDPAFLEKLPGGLPMLVKLLNMVFRG